METARSTYTLNAQQIEQVLAILQREQQARTPSPWQERNFKLLNIAISGLGIVVSIPILILLLFLAAKFIPGLEKAADFLAGIAFIFIVIAYLPLGLLAVGILILFSLNLPYVRRLIHQRRLVRRLGLLEALRAPWETERRKKRLRNALDLGVSILGPLLIAAVGFLIGIINLFNRPDNVFLPLGVLLLSCMLGGAIIATYFVRRSKERLGLISHLSASLERQKEEVEQKDDIRVQIPAETYETVAQIERAQISRERVQSILGSLEEPGTSPYALQKSHMAQQAQARLDASTRLRVQDRIDALMREPRPPGVTEDPTARTLHLRVPDTPLIIGFTVDDEARRIQIVSVEDTSDGTGSPSEAAG